MTVVAVTMVRDEADVIAATVRHMLAQVDAVVVADNLSIDGTSSILAELAAEFPTLTVVDDPDPRYLQSEKMTALARLATEQLGADWIVPFDADEVWYSAHHRRLADALEEIGPRWHVAPATLYDHVASGRDPDHPNPVVRIGWRRPDPAPLPKVAARARPDVVIEQGNHGAHYEEFEPAWLSPVLIIRHFPYRSVEQFLRKVRNGAAAYRAAGDAQRADHGAHWRQWGDLLDSAGEDAVAEIFRRWYWRGNPAIPVTIEGEKQPALIFDPVDRLP